jgi:hypothetical protein
MQTQTTHDVPPMIAMQRTLYRVDELVQVPEFTYLTKSGLRHLIFNSQPRFSASGDKVPGNGLVEAGAIIRIGRRVLIDAPKFREWALSQREVLAQA